MRPVSKPKRVASGSSRTVWIAGGGFIFGAVTLYWLHSVSSEGSQDGSTQHFATGSGRWDDYDRDLVEVSHEIVAYLNAGSYYSCASFILFLGYFPIPHAGPMRPMRPALTTNLPLPHAINQEGRLFQPRKG